jgi:hypothetical protein
MFLNRITKQSNAGLARYDARITDVAIEALLGVERQKIGGAMRNDAMVVSCARFSKADEQDAAASLGRKRAPVQSIRPLCAAIYQAY